MKYLGWFMIFMIGLITLLAIFYEEKHEYIFFTYNDIIGKSNNCYEQKNGMLVCEYGKDLVRVKYYYWED